MNRKRFVRPLDIRTGFPSIPFMRKLESGYPVFHVSRENDLNRPLYRWETGGNLPSRGVSRRTVTFGFVWSCLLMIIHSVSYPALLSSDLNTTQSAQILSGNHEATRDHDEIVSVTLHLEHAWVKSVRDQLAKRFPNRSITFTVLSENNSLQITGPRQTVEQIQKNLIPELDVTPPRYIVEFFAFQLDSSTPLSVSRSILKCLRSQTSIPRKTIQQWKANGIPDILMAPRIETWIGDSAKCSGRIQTGTLSNLYILSCQPEAIEGSEDIFCATELKFIESGDTLTDIKKTIRVTPGKDYYFMGMTPLSNSGKTIQSGSGKGPVLPEQSSPSNPNVAPKDAPFLYVLIHVMNAP